MKEDVLNFLENGKKGQAAPAAKSQATQKETTAAPQKEAAPSKGISFRTSL